MKYPMVYVEWLDSAFHAGWKTESERRPDSYSLSTCNTLGFLVFKSKREIHVAMQFSECGSVGEVMAIPRSVIRRMVKVSPSRSN